MKKHELFIVLLVLLTIFSGAFYWYEFKPDQVRKYCYSLSDARFQSTVIKGLDEKLEELNDEQKQILINKHGSLEEAKKMFQESLDEKFATEFLSVEFTEYVSKQKDYVYRDCLRERGIEK